MTNHTKQLSEGGTVLRGTTQSFNDSQARYYQLLHIVIVQLRLLCLDYFCQATVNIIIIIINLFVAIT